MGFWDFLITKGLNIDFYLIGGPMDGEKIKGNKPVITGWIHHDGGNEH